jgi:hypothetical protein
VYTIHVLFSRLRKAHLKMHIQRHVEDMSRSHQLFGRDGGLNLAQRQLVMCEAPLIKRVLAKYCASWNRFRNVSYDAET